MQGAPDLTFSSQDHAEILKHYLENYPLIFVDHDGSILEFNATAWNFFGHNPQLGQGMDVRFIFQMVGFPVEHFDRPIVFEALANKYDGSATPAQVRVVPLGVQRSMLFLSDLSVRNRLRDQLTQERQLLRTLIDTLPDFIYVKDKECKYLLNNQSHLRWLGVKAQDEALGRTAADFYPLENSSHFFREDQEILESGEGVLNREECVKGGLWMETSKVPIRDPIDNQIVGIVGVSRDVTDRKRAEDRIRQGQRLESIGLLAGGVAHDFNNLLTVIIGLAETADLQLGDLRQPKLDLEATSRELAETLAEIRKAGLRAASLTQKLLAVGRQQLVETKTLSLNEIILDMGSVLQGLMKVSDREGVPPRLEFKLDPQLGMIRADRAQVEQILLNLVVNGRDAIHKRSGDQNEENYVGTIEVRTSNATEKRRVLLEISDNGCGMTEEVKTRAFDPFFTTKGVGRGTGLGLASVYGILQQSGGAISIESELGKGTVFRVEFPLPEEKKTQITPSKTPADASLTESKGLQILVAEDDPVIRTLVRRNLKIHGHEVVDFGDGLQAWRAYEERPNSFDLVITDLLMPQMGGIEFFKKIQQINPDQVILCMSGYSNEDTGGMPLLHKPFTAQKLIDKIASLSVKK